MNSESWRQRAACRTMSTDTFFVREYDREAVQDVKEMCNNWCPVKDECLAFADSFENSFRGTFGIYGGLTPSERVDRRHGKVPAKECTSGGRRRSYDRHIRLGETPCTSCAQWNARRDDEHKRWNTARKLIPTGLSNHAIEKLTGVHRDTVNRLRQEIAAASV